MAKCSGAETLVAIIQAQFSRVGSFLCHGVRGIGCWFLVSELQQTFGTSGPKGES